MTPQEIKIKIDANNKKMEEIFNVGQFILNKEYYALQIENQKLQEMCAHEFVDGVCKYCGAVEPKHD